MIPFFARAYNVVWGSLRRPVRSENFIAQIDGLRFLSIWLVLCSHAWGTWVPYAGVDYAGQPAGGLGGLIASTLMQGKLGVFVFFAISGFVLSIPWSARQNQSERGVALRKFYLRRVTRLEPLYIFLMLSYYVGLSLIGRLSFSSDFDNLIASMFYMHNILYDEGSTIYLAAWSLEIEFQFYIIAPFLYGALFSLGPTLRRAIMIGAIVAGSGTQQLLPGLPDTLLYYVHYFLVGGFSADLYFSGQSGKGRRSIAFDAVFVLAYLAMTLLVPKQSTAYFGQLIFSLCIFMILISSFRGKFFAQFFAMPPIYIIGGMCYSIYLTHGRVMTGFYAFIFEGVSLTGNFLPDFFIVSAIVIPLSIIVGAVFFVLIERPTMSHDWPQTMANWLRRKVGWLNGRCRGHKVTVNG